MAIEPTSPVTGAAITGFTSPTYTLIEDYGRPNAHSRQWAVTTIGGTQTGVDAHSVSRPFTLTVERPSQFKQLGTPNPATGVISSVANNVFKLRLRKGLLPQSGQPDRTSNMELRVPVPSGADAADPENLKAMWSCLGGFIYDNADDLATMTIDGLI